MLRMRLYVGDCLDVLKTLEPNSVDAVVTDPPYGISFMGKHWDYEVPSIKVWREVMRVLKPGGHLLSFAGTRTYHRMAVNIEDAGFEVRDMVSWIYGQGFPKSLDISKAIDKAQGLERPRVPGGQGGKNTVLGARTPGEAISGEAIRWNGWGTALKPALEPVCLARKPLIGTVVENVKEHGVGGLNIDASRIVFASEDDKAAAAAAAAAAQRASQDQNAGRTAYGRFENGPASLAPYLEKMNQGRWPSNVILGHSPHCTEEACDLFDCAVSLMDGQSGITRSAGGRTVKRSGKYQEGKVSAAGEWTNQDPGFGDMGGASRFFYCAKVSSRERNAGLEGMPDRAGGIKNSSGRGYSERDPHKEILTKNHHPTVKPVKLMEYLCRLVTPPGGVILDPFMGSGSTGIAARNLGFQFIGIEREPEYAEIARLRIGLAEENLIADSLSETSMGS